MHLRALAASALLAFASGAVARSEPRLVRLPAQATSPHIGIKKGGVIGSMGKEASLKDWLVLNGARFANSEYPDLAKIVAENYAQQGYSKSPDPNFTQLPVEPFEADYRGEIIRGMAICPTRAICGDLVGSLMPFNLNSNL